jgi:hypothetical protein
VSERLAPTVEVEVVEGEHVVPRGTARTSWYYRRGDGWERVGQARGAVTTSRDIAPGTIWEHAVTLHLAVGTELRRVDESPGPPPRLDPLAYLKQGTKAPRYAIKSRHYRVARDGRLTADPGSR